jgi:hypothetical protein
MAGSLGGLRVITLDFDDGFSINTLNSVMPLQRGLESAKSTENIRKDYATLT